MDAVPGSDRDGAVAGIGGDEAVRRRRPGRRIGALPTLTVSWRTPTGPCRTVGARSGIGVEDTVVADPAEHLDPLPGEVVTDGNRVIAGVEDEQWPLALFREQADEATDLFDGG
jgi:hypothetical protein